MYYIYHIIQILNNLIIHLYINHVVVKKTILFPLNWKLMKRIYQQKIPNRRKN